MTEWVRRAVDAPLEYGGLDDAWGPISPLAVVEACFLLTLRVVAKAPKVEFVSLEHDEHNQRVLECPVRTMVRTYREGNQKTAKSAARPAIYGSSFHRPFVRFTPTTRPWKLRPRRGGRHDRRDSPRQRVTSTGLHPWVITAVVFLVVAYGPAGRHEPAQRAGIPGMVEPAERSTLMKVDELLTTLPE